MKFSKNWLQDYIVETLPDNIIIEDALNKKAFEVEGIENIKGQSEKEYTDSIFDIKVLPNRHGDALSHYYMAKEIAAILNLKSKLYKKEKVEIMLLNDIGIDNEITVKQEKIINIKIENKDACKVFEIVKIEGVDSRPSPEWLRSRMESIGHKSINAIVDVTNYVQFTMNKPLHAYDNDNVKGGFIIRMARVGEKLLTLDKKELELNKGLELDVETLIIADEEKPLGLAGIKGGMYSGINENTKIILLESANFDPILIRKASKKYNIRTDASKRFEAGQSDTLVHDGVEMAVALYREIFGNDIKVSPAYRAEGNSKISTEKNKIELTINDINEALGFNYKDEEIRKAIEAYDFVYTKDLIKYIINIPAERIDLKIKEDIIEEIGRVLGYDTLIPVLPNLNRVGDYNDAMRIEMQIRKYMSSMGYDEIMNYTLREYKNYNNSDSADFKNNKQEKDNEMVLLESSGATIALRTNISDGLIESFHRNLNNAPLMHLNIIRTYEIGSVFIDINLIKSSFVEYRSLSIICDDNKKKSNYKNELDFLIKGLAVNLGIENIKYELKSDKPATVEINLTDIYEQFKNNKIKGIIDLGIKHSKELKYKHLSMYPIITRDVSIYYNDTQSVESLLDIIKNTINVLAQTYYLIDSFERQMDDGTIKRSAAFRIVYQANDRTLTDEEINIEVDKVYQALKSVGCELR